MPQKPNKMIELKIETGDVAFCTGKALLSKLIMKFTGSKWSHTAIFYYQKNVLMVADSQKDGFNAKTFENWKKDYGYKFEVYRSSKLPQAFIELRIMEILGTTPYDFESLFFRHPKKIATIFLNRFRKNKKMPWKDRGNAEDERMYCSESVAYCLNLKSSERLSPEDLYNYVVKNDFYQITNEAF